MKLSIRGMSLAIGLLGSAAVLVAGLINYASPSYARPFLQIAESIYPGYHAGGGIPNLLFGVLYALADGIVWGALLAILYNSFSNGNEKTK